MTIEAIKLKFLEEFIVLQDEKLIRELYDTLQRPSKVNLSDFVGVWSEEEASQMQQATKECQKTDLNEW